MLNKIVYKKWSKIAKDEKNDQCAYINIFKRIVDMILIVFVGSNTPIELLLTKYHDGKTHTAKRPHLLKQFLPFLQFLTCTSLNINI